MNAQELPNEGTSKLLSLDKGQSGTAYSEFAKVQFEQAIKTYQIFILNQV